MATLTTLRQSLKALKKAQHRRSIECGVLPASEWLQRTGGIRRGEQPESHRRRSAELHPLALSLFLSLFCRHATRRAVLDSFDFLTLFRPTRFFFFRRVHRAPNTESVRCESRLLPPPLPLRRWKLSGRAARLCRPTSLACTRLSSRMTDQSARLGGPGALRSEVQRRLGMVWSAAAPTAAFRLNLARSNPSPSTPHRSLPHAICSFRQPLTRA